MVLRFDDFVAFAVSRVWGNAPHVFAVDALGKQGWPTRKQIGPKRGAMPSSLSVPNPCGLKFFLRNDNRLETPQIVWDHSMLLVLLLNVPARDKSRMRPNPSNPYIAVYWARLAKILDNISQMEYAI